MRIKNSIYICIIAAAVLLSRCLAIFAQQPASVTPAPKYTEVKYSADASSYKWEGDDRVLVLTGNVKFIQGDTVLIADKVDYREKSRTAEAYGNLKIYDERNSATAAKIVLNFKDKKGSLAGNAIMTIKPKEKKPTETASDSLKDKLKGEAIITCEVLDYFYKDKRAIVPGAVKIVQESRVLTADSALYTGNDEIVELTGNVKAEDSKDKHNFTSPKVRISLKDGMQWIEAEKASGTFYIKEDEEESAAAESKPLDSQPKQ